MTDLLDHRVNLVGRSPREIATLLEEYVDRAYRARQIGQWIVDRNATDFAEMTNLTNGKLTMCLSSQAGCAVGCTFCVTGAFGAGRNLTPDEIVGQYRVMLRQLEGDFDRVNIVFMGMGEPLLNTGHLGPALETLYERVSPKRITVSTSGILSGIKWLAGLDRRPNLAVSLNAPDQERRQHLMPIARRYPLAELMTELRVFPLERGRRITFEYVLIRDLNDQVADAEALAP